MAKAVTGERKDLVLEDFVPYQLSVLSNRISARIAKLYAERFDLSVTEWRVIAVLGRFHALSANRLAEMTAMDKVAVSRAVSGLLARKWVKRQTAAADRRQSVLDLTASGRRLHAEIAPLAIGLEDALMADFSVREREHLQLLLGKLGTRINAL